jgi:hypothetical protein
VILRVHVQGAEPYEIGGWGINEETLSDAIEAEAETIAQDAGSDLIEENTEACRILLRDEVIKAASRALKKAGDSYRDPTGVLWTLEESEV